MNDEVDIDAVLEYAVLHIAEPARHNFRIMFHWFINGGDEPGSRLLGEQIPGVDVGFHHCAQRGIHVPAAKWFSGGKQFVASISAKIGSLYDQTGEGEPFLELGDGTWVMLYSAHRNNNGNSTDTRWNDALRNNLVDGVPVGVFRQVSANPGLYVRSLAWVENYDATSNTFIIHGPITARTQHSLQSDINVERMSLEEDPPVEQLLRDERLIKRRETVVRKGQQRFRSELIEAYEGQCAVSGCEVPEVLQAAHIIGFRGELSNLVTNGILLREDIHTLYDRELLGIEPDSHLVHLDRRLVGTEYEELRGKKLRVPRPARLRPNEEYLATKFKNFERASAQIA